MVLMWPLGVFELHVVLKAAYDGKKLWRNRNLIFLMNLV